MPSTQDVAREEIDDLPVLVVARGQTAGRGRSGAEWRDADRALAASVAFRHESKDQRPISLMAGVAAARSCSGVGLKWPNDVLEAASKVGGILVERSSEVTVVGFGLNLWWPGAPAGMGAIFDSDPGPEEHARIGALWAAHLMELIANPGWPIDEYREVCVTLGKEITWEPDGEGQALDVASDGSLIVATPSGREHLHSGAVHHIRS